MPPEGAALQLQCHVGRAAAAILAHPLLTIDSYGTYDHLILLLGRLASFASRDLSRKRKANRPQSASPSGGSPPQFPGIVPTHGKFNVPLGFSPPMEQSPNTDSNDEFASPQTVEAAEHEWESIRQGFEALESCLGAQFKPLNSEYTDRKETPFGSALQYRTYSVAGIWMNYYMGLIHLYRSRPNMPPGCDRAKSSGLNPWCITCDSMAY